MAGDLINLDDDVAISPPRNINSFASKMANHPKPRTASGDSFSELTNLMKAKKSYAPIPSPTPRPPPTPRPLLAPVPNGIRFASRNTSNDSILSPLAKPFQAPESVAAYLQRQHEPTSPVSPPARPVPMYRKANVVRLDSLAEAIMNHNSDDDDARSPCMPSPPYKEPLLIPGLEPPIQIAPARSGPIDPPTPTESLQPSRSSEYRSSQEPVVRVTKDVWESMGKSLDAAQSLKKGLEEKLSVPESKNETLRNVDYDFGSQLDKLRYQNENHKVQKSSMGQALAQKEMELKKQQLDIDQLARKLEEAECKVKELGNVSVELEYLRGIKVSMETAHERALHDLVARDRELESAGTSIQELEQTIEHLTRERDAALRAQMNSGDHQNRAKNLANTLASREKKMNEIRLQLVTEQLRVEDLELEVESLKETSRKQDIEDLKNKLREKTRLYDSTRHRLKVAEAHLKVSQERVMKVANNGECLQGAAHLVKPNEKTRLPKTVYSCSECYANNLECDSNAVCRSCTQRNTPCARWRCSVKHKLGECNITPCKFPHDSQGWLVLQTERPQW